MKRTLEAKLGMYDSVREFCAVNSAILASIPALQSAFDDFVVKHDEVESLLGAESSSSKGDTALKRQAREKMETSTLEFAVALFAYAELSFKVDLKELAKLVPSDLARKSDEEISIVCRRIYLAANDNVAAMADYNLNAARFTAFLAEIDDYDLKVMRPKVSIGIRSGVKIQLNGIVAECDAILSNRLDKTVRLTKTASPGFYFGYLANRKVYDNPTQETTLRVEVQDRDGNPVSHASVSVLAMDQSIETDELGFAVFKPISPDTYDLSAAKEGFITAFLSDCKVSVGKSITFLIIIEAAA